MDPTDTTRRQTLECMVWAGAAALWTVPGGVPRATLIGRAQAAEPGGLSFIQISDSHIGFAGAPNPDTPATLTQAIAQLRAGKGDAAMLLHTGDVSHLSRDAQFDTAEKLIAGAGLDTRYVPGEHDVLVDGGRGFVARFTKCGPRGWYSFDQQGVPFIGLNNVQNPKAGGSFHSEAPDTDESFAWRFDQPGRFPYFFSLHAHMQGVVVVR